MIKTCCGCYFGYKSTVSLLIAIIIMKHYFFGYVQKLRITYDVFQAYINQENDTFFEDVSWMNEQRFSDFIDEKSLQETNVNVKKPLQYYPKRIKPMCRATLKPQFHPQFAIAQKVQLGGIWQPKNCKYANSVAILVPFRWRENHLKLFLPYMHLFLQNQLVKYHIFVVEQNGNNTFNRGKLMNIGFTEASKWESFDCYIFHDVDLFPLNENIIYNCSLNGPLHMSVGIDKFGQRLPYSVYFGGVTAFTEKQYKQVNGFSNKYFGWGGEDDALGIRVKLSGQKLVRLPSELATYKMIKHKRDKGNEENVFQRLRLLDKTFEEWRIDGLNSLNYNLMSYQMKPLYTKFLVDI